MTDFTHLELVELFFGTDLTEEQINQAIFDRYQDLVTELCLTYGIERKTGLNIYRDTIKQIRFLVEQEQCRVNEFNRLLKKSLRMQFEKESKFVDDMYKKVEDADLNNQHDISMLYVLNFCKQIKANPELAKELDITDKDIQVVFARFGINTSARKFLHEKNSKQIAKSQGMTEQEVAARYATTINKIKKYSQQSNISNTPYGV